MTLSVSWLGVAIVQLAVASVTLCHLHVLLLDPTLASGRLHAQLLVFHWTDTVRSLCFVLLFSRRDLDRESR